MTALAHLKVLVPESRELDLFGAMLEAEGATVIRCPMIQILDLDQTAEAEAWIEMAVDGAFTDIIWLTGEGLRRLMPIANRMGREHDFLIALRQVRSITRGPKPTRALRELGLASGLSAAPPTSQGAGAALQSEAIAGRTIGIQLYPGDGALPLVDQLRARGARVFPVTPYRYASDAETGQVLDIIRALAQGQIGLIAFTATPQIDRLFQVAKAANLETELRAGLARTPIAAVGPVVEQTLRAYGLASAIRPAESFHLKPLVRAIIAACASWEQKP
jgi:uroporphyrinogen-III synthase